MTVHQALANDFSRLIKAIDGYKTYLMCVLWAGTIISAHFGMPVPGTSVDPDANWVSQLLLVATTACGRSAFAKLIAAIEKAAPILNAVLAAVAAAQQQQTTAAEPDGKLGGIT